MIFTSESPSKTCPIVGAIRKDDGAWSNRNWDSSGRCFEIGERNPKADLVEVREPVELEIVVADETNKTWKYGTIDEQATEALQVRGKRTLPANGWKIIRVREVLEP